MIKFAVLLQSDNQNCPLQLETARIEFLKNDLHLC